MTSPSADKPTLQPVQYSPARGFAIGVALAAVATVVLRGYVVPIDDVDFTLDTPAIVGGCAIAVPSGLAGGWLIWRGFEVRPHVSLVTAIGIAIGTSLLSIWIAGGYLWRRGSDRRRDRDWETSQRIRLGGSWLALHAIHLRSAVRTYAPRAGHGLVVALAMARQSVEAGDGPPPAISETR